MYKFIFLLLVIISGCGGGKSPNDIYHPVPMIEPFPTSAVFIGNSITFSSGVPGSEWALDGGMAASDAAHDYVHIVSASLGITTPSIYNFASLERNPTENIPNIPQLLFAIDNNTLVVIELGDNAVAGGSAEFTNAYNQLLTAASKTTHLRCVSTWWEDTAKDAMIKAACKAHNGVYVYIGDIFPNRRDDVGRYANAGIDSHPHNWSMDIIARRILGQ